MNALVSILVFVAAVFAAFQAFRERNFGWAAWACVLFAAFLWLVGPIRITDS